MQQVFMNTNKKEHADIKCCYNFQRCRYGDTPQ